MAAAKKKAAPKAKVVKKTAAEKTEVSSESIQLLLGNMIKEKDRTYYYETYLKLVAKQKTAASAVSDFGKKAKEAGVDMGSLKSVIKLEKMDPLDLATMLKQLAAFMSDRGLPVQLSLYEPKFGSVEDQAKKLGWDAGIAGRNPPIELFPEASPGHVPMMRAYNDAQAQIVLNNKGDEAVN